MPPLTGRERGVSDRTNSRSNQPIHFVPDRVTHSPNLAMSSLVNDDSQHTWLHLTNLGRSCDTIVQLDALS